MNTNPGIPRHNEPSRRDTEEFADAFPEMPPKTHPHWARVGSFPNPERDNYPYNAYRF